MSDRTSPDIETPIPGIEEASEEYLLDLAFDDRLDRLFDYADHDIQRFDIDTETLFEVDQTYVPFTHSYAIDGTENPTCKLKIDGLRYKGMDGDHLRVRLVPDIFYGDATILETTSGGYKATTGAVTRELSSKEAAGMILRATGTDSASLDSLVQKNLIDASMYPTIAERALFLLAEQRGHQSRESALEIAALESTVEQPVMIRIGRVETEAIDESTVKLVLEKVWIHPELDAEEAYRFALYFSQSHDEHASQAMTVATEKSVRGDGYSLKSASFIYKDAHGKTSPIDMKDHNIVKLFVNAYDELID